MDSLTHTLTALALARLLPLRRTARLPRRQPRRLAATATLLVAANVADLDIAFATAGDLAYLEQHRAASHSLLAAAGLGAAVGFAAWYLAQRRGSPAGSVQRSTFILLGVTGGLSHCLLDWLNPYGVQLFWPFRTNWYGLDWFSLTDPWLLMVLVLGLALPLLFRLIAEEIGAERSESGPRWGAALALAAFALLALGRSTLQSGAVAELSSRQYGNRALLRAGAFPTPLNPFRWNGVVETDATYEQVEVLLHGPNRGVRLDTTHYKPSPSDALAAALHSRTAQVFLRWARFPHATMTPTIDGWRLGLQDLRYAKEAPRVRIFRAWIDLDAEPSVQRETLRWGTTEPPD